MRSEAGPELSEDLVGGTALTDDLQFHRQVRYVYARPCGSTPYSTVIARVVVDIDDARCACVQTRLDESVILGKVG